MVHCEVDIAGVAPAFVSPVDIHVQSAQVPWTSLQGAERLRTYVCSQLRFHGRRYRVLSICGASACDERMLGFCPVHFLHLLKQFSVFFF